MSGTVTEEDKASVRDVVVERENTCAHLDIFNKTIVWVVFCSYTFFSPLLIAF